jgi:hypothetical protein
VYSREAARQGLKHLITEAHNISDALVDAPVSATPNGKSFKVKPVLTTERVLAFRFRIMSVGLFLFEIVTQVA